MDLLHTLLYATCAILNLILGGLVLVQGSKTTSHRFFFYFSVAQFFWIVSLFLGFQFADPNHPELSTFFIRLADGIGSLLVFILPGFFYTFPRKTFSLPRWSILTAGVLSGLVFFISTFTGLVEEAEIYINGSYGPDAFGPLYTAYNIFMIAGLLATVMISIKKIFDLHGLEQKQMIIAAVGCWLFVGFTLMTNAILPLFDIFIFQQESPVFSLFFLFPAFVNILLQSNIKEETAMLKQLIDRKTQSLKKQNEKIKTLVQQQSDFIAVAAHEFRTPLTIAMLQLEDTLSTAELSPSAREEMQVIDNSLNKLKHLTQDLFDVQQYDLEKARLNLKTIDLFDFIRNIYEEFEDIMNKKCIQLDLDFRPIEVIMITIDEAKMRQVIHNLLNNAYKFTPEKGQVMIRVEALETEIQIRIIDNGKGISDEIKKRLFKKFKSGETTDSGIGLGLYLCRKIIELHQGKIVISDNPGGGAIFQITLPPMSVNADHHVRVLASALKRENTD